MNYIWFLLVIPFLISPAYGQQVINVNTTTPCFLNYTAGVDMWENCGADEDYISFALLPWEWITGGYFSMILVAIIVLITYLKYHKVVYPIIIGILFLPITFALFPENFLMYAVVFTSVAIGISIFYIVKRQTD